MNYYFVFREPRINSNSNINKIIKDYFMNTFRMNTNVTDKDCDYGHFYDLDYDTRLDIFTPPSRLIEPSPVHYIYTIHQYKKNEKYNYEYSISEDEHSRNLGKWLLFNNTEHNKYISEHDLDTRISEKRRERAHDKHRHVEFTSSTKLEKPKKKKPHFNYYCYKSNRYPPQSYSMLISDMEEDNIHKIIHKHDANTRTIVGISCACLISFGALLSFIRHL